jgi:hypothetical protein
MPCNASHENKAIFTFSLHDALRPCNVELFRPKLRQFYSPPPGSKKDAKVYFTARVQKPCEQLRYGDGGNRQAGSFFFSSPTFRALLLLGFRIQTGDQKRWIAFSPQTSTDRKHETKWFEWTHPPRRERSFPTLTLAAVAGAP